MVCDENLDGNSSFLLIRATHSEQIEQINCKAWKYQDADPYHSLTETTLPPMRSYFLPVLKTCG